LVVKICLLAVAMLLAAVNLVRTRPRLAAGRSRPELADRATLSLRRLVTGEVVLVVAAVSAAAALSSLPPPSKALASVGSGTARVGPGAVRQVVNEDGFRIELRVSPNRAAVPNAFALRITRGGRPANVARVIAGFTMLDMEMGSQQYVLRRTAPGLYERSIPALVMVGHWGLAFEITPPGGQPFTVSFVDRATG
jgi:copper transport protein